MAGIESFQQSGLRISRVTARKRANTRVSWEHRGLETEGVSTLEKAMRKEMTPLRSSFIRTAVAAL
jgi:hypothetical protein